MHFQVKMTIVPPFRFAASGIRFYKHLKNLLSQRRKARKEKRIDSRRDAEYAEKNAVYIVIRNNRFYLCALCAFAREHKDLTLDSRLRRNEWNMTVVYAVIQRLIQPNGWCPVAPACPRRSSPTQPVRRSAAARTCSLVSLLECN